MEKGLRLVLIVTLFLGLASANFWQVAKEFRGDSFGPEVLDSWTVSGLNDPKVSNCNGESLVGGNGIAAKATLSKTFNSDVELTTVNIEFDLYLLDNWISGYESGKTSDAFTVLINDKKVYTIGSDASRQLHSQATNICGGSQKDRKTKASFTVPVTGKSFKLTFQGEFAAAATATSSSWGIRELYVLGDNGSNNAQNIVSELNNDSNFDVSQWISNVGNGISTCPKKLLGGYGVAGPGAKFQRLINNLPTHSFLTIKLDAYFIDSLDVNDSIVFYVDGKIAHEQGKLWDLATTNVCGAGWAEYNQQLIIQVPHFDSSAQIIIYVNTDQAAGDESFGFRDFNVSVSAPCPIIYSEVNGKGKTFSFCGSIPNLKEVGWTFPIKGIFIPDGLVLTVYQDSQYKGKKFSVSQTNLQLTGQEYVLINKAFKIDVNEHKLRHRQ